MVADCPKGHGLYIYIYPQAAWRPGELIEIADWVFGPNSFPDLSILAYGDFSYYIYKSFFVA